MVLDKVVELLIGKALDRALAARAPRRQLAKLFIELNRSLAHCHFAYVEYQRGLQTGPSEARSARTNWERAIRDLAKAIQALAPILQIHGENLLDALGNYHHFEAMSFDPVSNGLANSLEHEALENWHRESEIDFKSVQARLRHFMVDTLKLSPEELLDATRLL